MIHERKSIAHLQPSTPLGLQAQRRLTGNILCGSMFSKRNVTSWATPDGCTGTVLPLHALFIPQAERKVNEPLYPDCATVRFCNSSVHRSVLLWSTYLNGETILDFPMSHWLFPASVQGRYFNNTILSTRWYPCKKRIKPIPQFLFKKAWPAKWKTYCAGNLGRGHILTQVIDVGIIDF